MVLATPHEAVAFVHTAASNASCSDAGAHCTVRVGQEWTLSCMLRAPLATPRPKGARGQPSELPVEHDDEDGGWRASIADGGVERDLGRYERWGAAAEVYTVEARTLGLPRCTCVLQTPIGRSGFTLERWHDAKRRQVAATVLAKHWRGRVGRRTVAAMPARGIVLPDAPR